MSYKHVIKMFEERKDKLSDIIHYRELETEHKTRLEGAIDEIEFLLTTLRHEMRVGAGEISPDQGIAPLVQEELMQERKQLEGEKDMVSLQEEMQEQRQLREE